MQRNMLVCQKRGNPHPPPELFPLKLGCLVPCGSLGGCVTGDRLWLTEERDKAWLCRPVSMIYLETDSASGLSLLLLFSRN